MKIEQVFAYAKRNSRRNFDDYGDLRLWRSDYRQILKDKQKAQKLFWYFKDKEITGIFNRLTVTENTIDYCSGQYPPTEIWFAVYAMMQTILNRGQ